MQAFFGGAGVNSTFTIRLSVSPRAVLVVTPVADAASAPCVAIVPPFQVRCVSRRLR